MHTNAKRGKMKTQKETRRENEPNNEHAVKKQKTEIKKKRIQMQKAVK